MIKIENINTFGWEAAIRGMRNPMNSWEKSDTGYRDDESDKFYRSLNEELGIDKCRVSLGPNDEKLMKSLIRGGPVEAKFRRMIHVQMDITAPLYWWKEFDTYKVGTVANSCSTMHKIHAKEFIIDDFSHEYLYDFTPDAPDGCTPMDALKTTIDILNYCRKRYLITQNKEDWWQMIQLLPSSYNQKRTVDLSYEVLANIYKHRKNHKLDEWRKLCRALVKNLAYSWIFTEEWDWENMPKEKPVVETKTEEEKNEKPASGRFPWGNDPIPVNYINYAEAGIKKPTSERFPRRNDAPDGMIYAVPYVEWLKKQKDRKKGATGEKPEHEPKEDDKDKVFAMALIEAIGTLREWGYSNKEIFNILTDIFEEV